MTAPLLSVCISTRDRPADLVECLRSLRHLDGLEYEVLVVDDGSHQPVEEAVRAGVGLEVRSRLAAVLRNERSAGYIAARNRMPRLARAPHLLVLDDDTILLDGGPVRRGLEVLQAHPTVGAVGFAQGDPAGNPYPGFMQPSPRGEECLAPCYYGYAHLLRRDLFLELGGYREELEFFGEEGEFCKRMLDRRRFVAYVPRPPVAHNTFSKAAGRSGYRRLYNGCRNKCFDAIWNEPLPLPLLSIPVRLYGHARYVRHLVRTGDVPDLSAGREVMKLGRELFRRLPGLLRQRRPLRWSTIRLWHKTLKTSPDFPTAVRTEVTLSAQTHASLYGRLRKWFRLAVPPALRRWIWANPPVAGAVGRLKERLARGASHDEVYDADYFAQLNAVMEQSAGVVAETVFSAFRPRRVIDVGCGSGAVLAALRDRGVAVLGYDLAEASLAACRARGLDARRADFASARSLGEEADVVISTEVAEHLPPTAAESFVELLSRAGGVIVFTAAPPGQGGTDHRNEQPNEYWVEKFQARGFEYQAAVTRQWRQQWADAGVVSWYHQNLMIFRRPGEVVQTA
jgi:glycosyltransferase involved in cell wall biosynthesis